MTTLSSIHRRREAGYSLTELVVVCAILTILAGLSFPVARFTLVRQKEMELAFDLRLMRNAIDEFKRYSDAGLIPVELGTEGYPADFEALIEPVDLVGQVDVRKRFLRRIPIDPMTGEQEWGMRSHRDEPDSSSWGGESLYDVYTLSEATGLNGVPYAEW